MDSVSRALIVYMILLLVFRLLGRRTLAQMTSFDFVLMMVIGESTQNALLGDDYSVSNGVLVIVTLVGMDVLLSLVKREWPRVDHWLDGLPLVVVDNGRPLSHLMRKASIDEEDILSAARERQGLERMDQIKYAVLEASGGISIIPKQAS